MLQSTTLDSHTVVVRADAESDMHALLAFIQQTKVKNKEKTVARFLDFARDNYVTEPLFKFNRDELYD